jgi:hypothetical protein
MSWPWPTQEATRRAYARAAWIVAEQARSAGPARLTLAEAVQQVIRHTAGARGTNEVVSARGASARAGAAADVGARVPMRASLCPWPVRACVSEMPGLEAPLCVPQL